MFCSNCGTSLVDGVRFCKSCGTAQQPPVASPSNLVGFSPRIADPAYAKYQKNTKRWALLFAGILFVVASIGFPIYGSSSGEVDFPQSLY